jgi:predicted MFS family arabinose efflux permease
MQTVIERYRAFVFAPGMPRVLLLLFIARMPVGMLGLSVLLFTREAYQSFAPAGATVGAFLMASALTAPALGRLIDRVGPKLPARVTGLVQPLMIIALIFAIAQRAPLIVTLVAAALVGVFSPPVTAVTRSVWRQRFSDDEARKTAFSLDSVMIEVNFTLGPMLVAAVVAWVSPAAAIYLALAAATLAAIAFNSSPIFDDWQKEPPQERHWLGPLTDPTLLKLLVTAFGLTYTFGVLEVLYPAYGALMAVPALGGILIAVNSLGSGIAGFAYGGVSFASALHRQYALLLLGMGLAMLAHALPLQPLAFGVVALIGGIFISPGITAHTLLVARAAPPKYATEAFTWSSTCILTGIGVGTTSAGWIIERHSIMHAAIGAAIVAMVAAGIAFTVRLPTVTAVTGHST